MSEYINGTTDILGGSVIRYALNTTTPNQAVIRKIIAGNGISITSTGVDPGTGDVTISVDISGGGSGGTGSGEGTGGGTTTGGGTSNVGTVTSVNMTVPTGLTILGAPITSAGTLALRLSSGYSIPLTSDINKAIEAYSKTVAALTFNTTNGVLTITQQDGGGVVAAITLSPFTTSNLAEGANLYFTNTRAREAISLTTTGISGNATYTTSTGVINVPNYTITINNNGDQRVVTGSDTANTLNANTKLFWYNDYGILALNSTASWGYGAEIDFVNTDVNGTTWGFYGGSTTDTGFMLYRYQPSQVELAYWNTDRYSVRSDVKIGWSSTLLSFNTMDVSFSREAAGLVQVNDGNANTYADIKAKVHRATQGFYAYRTGGNQAFIGLDTSGSGGKEWYMGSVGSNGVDPGSIMWNNETDQLSPMSLSSTTLKLKVDTGLSWTTASTTDSVTYTVGFEVAAANTLKLNNGSTGFGYLNLNNIKASALAGTGNRIVIADATGVLVSATIGSGLSYSGGILTATGTLTSASFATDYDDTVTGLRNSSNTVYTTSQNFVSGSTRVFVNGVRQSRGASYDYTETGANQITFNYAPDSGDLILVDYIKS